MEGIAKALEYAVDLAEPKVLEIGGFTYTDKKVTRVTGPEIDTLGVCSLTALVEYIRDTGLFNFDMVSDCENIQFFGQPMVHIVSPDTVKFISQLRPDTGSRDIFVNAEARTPEIQYGRYYENEFFNVLMQSSFGDTTDREIILRVIGNLVEKNVKSVTDDGVSQAVTVKSGIASVDNVIVPNPVTLKPFRTFAEVAQPESRFIFRMQDGGKCALFEADGGAWRLEAMSNIKEFLKEALPGVRIIC